MDERCGPGYWNVFWGGSEGDYQTEIVVKGGIKADIVDRI